MVNKTIWKNSFNCKISSTKPLGAGIFTLAEIQRNSVVFAVLTVACRLLRVITASSCKNETPCEHIIILNRIERHKVQSA